jgi:hypothetical protein
VDHLQKKAKDMEMRGVILLLFGMIIFGYRTYVAWFLPDQHYAYLEWMGNTFYSWDAKSKRILTSTMSIIFFRLAFTLFFIMILFSASILLNRIM